MFRISKSLPVIVVLLIGLLPMVAWSQTISFNPGVSMPSEPQFSVPLAIDCAGLDVKGLEVSVNYDPTLVRLDAITAGPWYTGGDQAFFFFDHTSTAPDGVIHFDGVFLEGTLSGAADLAICHFTALEFGTSPLEFIDVDVRDLANTDLGFTHSTGDLILLDPVVKVRDRAFGAIKSLFR